MEAVEEVVLWMDTEAVGLGLSPVSTSYQPCGHKLVNKPHSSNGDNRRLL